MRERYQLLTRDLNWNPSYVTEQQLYPHTRSCIFGNEWNPP